MAKWLARSGWNVTVVTPRASVWRRADESVDLDRALEREQIRCLRTRHDWRFLSPRRLVAAHETAGWLGRRVGDRLALRLRRLANRLDVPVEIGWVRQAERAGSALAPSQADLILVTGSPFAAFAAARRLSRRLRCPYVLDYRDLWSGNPYVERRSSGRTLAHEKRLLQESAAAIAVSPGLARILRGRFGEGPRIEVLTNGFDREELAAIRSREFGHFALVYTGRFYPPKSVVTPILRAVSVLAARPQAGLRPWAFHYFGRHADHVREEAHRLGVEARVFVHGEVTRREALEAVRGAGMASVVTSIASEGSPEDLSVITGKIFEAIGLGTPILAIAPPGSDLESVLSTVGLGRRFSGDETRQIADYLAEGIAGRVVPPREPEAFDWARLAPRLDRLLRKALRAEAIPTLM
jgi:glycosyltransferase involved in cell wall biosynthesis